MTTTAWSTIVRERGGVVVTLADDDDAESDEDDEATSEAVAVAVAVAVVEVLMAFRAVLLAFDCFNTA